MKRYLRALVPSSTLATMAIIPVLILGGVAARPAVAAGTSSTSLPLPSFSAPPVYSLAGGSELPGINSMATGDFNGDGTPDLATVPFGGAAPGATQNTGASIYIGKGDGTFAAPVQYAAGLYPYAVITARLRGPNAPLDLVVADAGVDQNGHSSIAVLLGNGNGTFQAPKITTIPYSAVSMAVGDFNGDGKLDLAVSSPSTGFPVPEELTILLGNGDGTFQAPTPSVAGEGTSVFYAMTVGDFTHDGKLDVLGMDPTGLWLSIGNGDGTFKPATLVWSDPTTYVGGQNLGGPTSFAVGDFNGDGNLDVALDVDGARLDVLLGTGTGVFVPATTPVYQILADQTGEGGGQIAAADLNGGGKLDLVASTGWGATVAVLAGNGDGTFRSPVVYPLPESDDAALVVADVNKDGKPDIVTATDLSALSGGVNYLSVLLNQGNGTFPRPQQYSVVAPYNHQSATTTNPVGVALGDFNGDGKRDLVVTEFDLPFEPIAHGQLPSPPTVNIATDKVDTGGTIAVMLGNGDGSFQSETQYYVGGRPIAVATAKLTGDGKQDIVVADAYSNTLSLLKGNGDGTFQSAITIPVGTNPNAIALADLNGDGKPDIAVTDLVDNEVSILINTSTPGHLSFQAPVSYPAGTYPDAVVAGDFNHDGKTDLAVLNDGNPYSQSSPSTLSILLGKGNGTFQTARTQTLWPHPGADALAIGSFFGTRSLDLAVANFARGQVMVLQGHTDGSFTPAGTYSVGEGPESIGVADFNGDGHLDLAVDDLNDNTIAILLGNGRGAFMPAADPTSQHPLAFGVTGFAYPAFLAVGALTSSCRPDIVTTNLFTATVTVLKNTTKSADKQLTCK